MSGAFTRGMVAAVAISAVSACASTQQTYVSPGDVDLSAYPPVTLGNDEVTILREMSDANVMGHIIQADSMEMAAADTAARWTKSDDINAFAKMLHLAHQGDMAHVKDIATQMGMIPTVDVTKLRASHVAALIDSVHRASDIQVDQYFLRSQIQLHEHLLAEIQTLQGTRHRAALQQELDALVPVMRDHLARAHALAKSKGVEK